MTLYKGETVQTTRDIKSRFIEMYKDYDFTNGGMLEIVGESFVVDGSVMFGAISKGYAEKEHKWYLSQSLNVNTMEGEVPTIWKDIADINGNINSNYGYLALSEGNGKQFQNAVESLKKNKNSRQAIMIYTRPSIHTDACTLGRLDFICTNTQQFIIRKNKLHMVVNQRSCDAVYGYRYDMAWADYLRQRALKEIQKSYKERISLGDLILQVGSLHVYPRHFKLIEESINENK